MLWLRIFGLLTILSSLLYWEWLFTHVDSHYLAWAWSFTICTILGSIPTVVFILNNLSRKPVKTPLISDMNWPKVAVIIPVWNEPIDIVERTIRSVVSQDYPQEQITVIVTDDGRSPVLKQLVSQLAKTHRKTGFIYTVPPMKGTLLRDRLGEGKAGNLNSALHFIADSPSYSYVETRDCDDIVPNRHFLKYCITYLVRHRNAGFVQTIKDVAADKYDTFDNRTQHFYRHEMRSKYAANAIFPCGSGVVYRKAAVASIGGFASWNLVEDFQTGMEILKKGWDCGYLPIVGAYGQIAPQDMPNFYKQRGTWTLDAVRLLLFRTKKGLTARQRLHFMESALHYSLAWTLFPIALTPSIALILNQYPFRFNWATYASVFLSQFFFSQLFVYIAHGRPSIRQFIRTYQVFTFAMAFVYLTMSLKALIYGPNRKPRYVNTRKVHQFGLYWKEVLPQLVMLIILLSAAVYHFIESKSFNTYMLASLLWSCFFIYMFGYSVRLAVYGYSFSSNISRHTPLQHIESQS